MKGKFNALVPVLIGTLYLLVYTLIVNLSSWQDAAFTLYMLSPLVVISMTIAVLKAEGPRENQPFPFD